MRRLLSDPIFEATAHAPARSCDHPGCLGVGDFRAPKSRLDLHDYHWFCLEHVRAYNLAWNYYAGMSDEEIEAEIRHDTVWQRPTWRLGMRHGPSLGPRLPGPLGMSAAGAPADGGRDRRETAAARRVRTEREQALAVFDLESPFTLVQLK